MCTRWAMVAHASSGLEHRSQRRETVCSRMAWELRFHFFFFFILYTAAALICNFTCFLSQNSFLNDYIQKAGLKVFVAFIFLIDIVQGGKPCM